MTYTLLAVSRDSAEDPERLSIVDDLLELFEEEGTNEKVVSPKRRVEATEIATDLEGDVLSSRGEAGILGGVAKSSSGSLGDGVNVGSPLCRGQARRGGLVSTARGGFDGETRESYDEL